MAPPVSAGPSRYASRPSSGGDGVAARGAGAGVGGVGGGSGSRRALDDELEQLKSQVAAMQRTLGGQLGGGGVPPAPVAAMGGGGLAWGQGQYYPKVYHPYAMQQQQFPMPWGMGATGGFPGAAAGAGEGLVGAAAAAAMAGNGGGSSSSRGLPQELASDGEMVALHQRHLKQMAVLRMELDHAKGEAELQQVRQQLAALMGGGGEKGRAGKMGLASIEAVTSEIVNNCLTLHC